MLVTKYLATVLAAAVLTAGGATLSPSAFADARPSAECKKAKKAKAKKVKKAKKAKAKKVAAAPAPTPAAKPRMNHETVIGMHRRGATQSEIVSTAEKFGYAAGAEDQKRLAQARLPKTLIAKLAADEPPPPAPEGIKLETISSYEDIDFDAVPPPPGTPGWVKQQNNKKASAKPAAVAAAAPARAQPAVHKASTVRKVQDEDEEEGPAPAPSRRAIVSAQ